MAKTLKTVEIYLVGIKGDDGCTGCVFEDIDSCEDISLISEEINCFNRKAVWVTEKPDEDS